SRTLASRLLSTLTIPFADDFEFEILDLPFLVNFPGVLRAGALPFLADGQIQVQAALVIQTQQPGFGNVDAYRIKRAVHAMKMHKSLVCPSRDLDATRWSIDLGA